MKDKKNKSWDYLNILTKNEIIQFLKEEQWFNAPNEDTVKFFKWNISSKKLLKELDDHIENRNGIELAKEIDRLGELFNKEKDNSKKLKLLEKRSLLFKKLQNQHKEFDLINKKLDENDKLLKPVHETKKN